METKNLIKNVLRRNLTTLQLLTGKTHENLLQLCFSLFSFQKASLDKKNEYKLLNHLRFKNLFKVIIDMHATIQ